MCCSFWASSNKCRYALASNCRCSGVKTRRYCSVGWGCSATLRRGRVVVGSTFASVSFLRFFRSGFEAEASGVVEINGRSFTCSFRHLRR